MEHKIVVYTALYGDKDRLRAPWVRSRQADYVCFTDAPQHSKGWQIRQVPGHHSDPCRSAKLFKVRPERVLASYEYSLWVDASRIIAVRPELLIERYLRHADIAVFEHPERRCIYEEARACKQLGKDSSKIIDAQMQTYRREGYPPNHGLSTCTVILRRHTPMIAQFNAAWWSEIQRHSRRDQLSFDYCARKLRVPLARIPGDAWHTPLFPYCKHKDARRSLLPSLCFILAESRAVRRLLAILSAVVSALPPPLATRRLRDGTHSGGA